MKNTQKGRSMVEMLGVLAIIGVLSIGGIAGYTTSMNRYRANQIMDAAAKVAVLAQTANQGQGGAVYAGADTSCPEADYLGKAPTNSGISWATLDGVAGMCAEANENSNIVKVTLTATPTTDGVVSALENIAGQSDSNAAAGYNGSNIIYVRSN